MSMKNLSRNSDLSEGSVEGSKSALSSMHAE